MLQQDCSDKGQMGLQLIRLIKISVLSQLQQEAQRLTFLLRWILNKGGRCSYSKKSVSLTNKIKVEGTFYTCNFSQTPFDTLSYSLALLPEATENAMIFGLVARLAIRKVTS